MKYFTFDLNGNGFDFHDTEEEAKNFAEQRLDYYKQNGDLEFINISWGEIKESVHSSDAVLELKAIKD